MSADALLLWLNQHQSLCILTLALLLERWLKIPSAWHPMVLIRALAKQLANKVHHPERHDSQQQRIAGLMACLLMLLFCVPLPLLLRELSPLAFLIDGLVLISCFSWHPMACQLNQLAQANPEQQKQLRKTMMGHWVARDCSRLSPLGLNKAAIEAVYLRSWHDQVAILFWFMAAGSWAALSYRVLLELSRCWHPRHNKMLDFSYFSSQFRALLDLIPQSLWALWLLLTTFRRVSKANIQSVLQFDSKPRGLLLLAATAQHSCDTGGPALYNQVKHERPRLQGTHPPQAQQIQAALQSINLRLLLFMVVIWLLGLTQPLWLP